ncbi:Tropomodulin-2 [Entophlyctis luteolus]|nr:Tropomodulin-2 [Entophlyctis luteolus]
MLVGDKDKAKVTKRGGGLFGLFKKDPAAVAAASPTPTPPPTSFPTSVSAADPSNDPLPESQHPSLDVGAFCDYPDANRIRVPPVPRSLDTSVGSVQHHPHLEQPQKPQQIQHAAPASPPPRDPLPLAPAQGVLEYAIMPDADANAPRTSTSSSMATGGLPEVLALDFGRRDSVNSVDDVVRAVRLGRTLPDEPSIISRTSRISRKSALSRPAQEVFRTIQFVKVDDPDFTRLNFKNNQALNDANIMTLIHALHGNRHLRHLNLQNTHVNDQHAVEIAAMLKVNHGLQVLNLRDNYIGPNGVEFVLPNFFVQQKTQTNFAVQVKAIVSSLSQNSSLRELKLGNQNPVPSVAGGGAVDVAFERSIASAVLECKSLRKLEYDFRDEYSRGIVQKTLASKSGSAGGA